MPSGSMELTLRAGDQFLGDMTYFRQPTVTALT